jgi:hypothetical protein
VIGMRVRNDRAFDRLPRVDIEVAGGAIEAFGARDDQVFEVRQSSPPLCAICDAGLMVSVIAAAFRALMVDSAGKSHKPVFSGRLDRYCDART